jgi:hypothetical protein
MEALENISSGMNATYDAVALEPSIVSSEQSMEEHMLF